MRLRRKALVDVDGKPLAARMIRPHLANPLNLVIETGGAKGHSILGAPKDSVVEVIAEILYPLEEAVGAVIQRGPRRSTFFPDLLGHLRHLFLEAEDGDQSAEHGVDGAADMLHVVVEPLVRSLGFLLSLKILKCLDQDGIWKGGQIAGAFSLEP